MEELEKHGVAVLRGVFAADRLTRLRDAAGRCLDIVSADRQAAARSRFNPFSFSVPIGALLDFGVTEQELTGPLSAPGLHAAFQEALGCNGACNLEQSWVRKKYAPLLEPNGLYHPQTWHQDGALGVQFPPDPGPEIPMTELLTCWIPLNPCGIDSPGLEFIRSRQKVLLHFTELEDSDLRKQFTPEEFWAPSLDFGDGVLFLNGTLHRTYAIPGMRLNRLSVEYRIFPH